MSRMQFSSMSAISDHERILLKAMMGFGFSPHVWNLAYTFDSLALNNLLVIAILYSYFHQVEIRSRDDVSSSKNKTICRIIFFLCGVALTNQHQSIFIILPILIEIWLTEITNYRGFALGEMMIFLCFGIKSINQSGNVILTRNYVITRTDDFTLTDNTTLTDVIILTDNVTLTNVVTLTYDVNFIDDVV